jgi:hypothetical protein
VSARRLIIDSWSSYDLRVLAWSLWMRVSSGCMPLHHHLYAVEPVLPPASFFIDVQASNRAKHSTGGHGATESVRLVGRQPAEVRLPQAQGGCATSCGWRCFGRRWVGQLLHIGSNLVEVVLRRSRLVRGRGPPGMLVCLTVHRTSSLSNHRSRSAVTSSLLNSTHML